MMQALPYCAALAMPYWRANLILCLTTDGWREWQSGRDMAEIIPAIDEKGNEMNDIMPEPRLTGRPKSSQPVPDDFARYASVEGDLKLRTRYGVGRPVIVRWRTETGIYCGSPRGKRCASRSSVTRPKPYRSRGNPRYTPAVMTEISWYDGEDDINDILSVLNG